MISKALGHNTQIKCGGVLLNMYPRDPSIQIIPTLAPKSTNITYNCIFAALGARISRINMQNAQHGTKHLEAQLPISWVRDHGEES